MSPTPKTQTGSPRRQRLKQNRNPEAGMRNRQKGLFKKTHTWYRYYGGDVLIFIKRPDGRLRGYESRPGLLPEFAKLSGRYTKHNSPRRKIAIFKGKHSYHLQLHFIELLKLLKFAGSLFPTISRVKPSVIYTNILPTLNAAITTITIAITKEIPEGLIVSVKANF
ncbi:hypothetical protein FBEOM_3043 [Fusarium beomiforme]|uniref:Uncharacterized protein n=1 Tax=Fusarium beomiforme TaxID=44412 RepID=A0A9P5AQN1_9HYPO|nr:hypothetical protein FBEOM_3043 [Fusarium beomiforme]